MGEYIIKKTSNDGFVFNIVANNKEITPTPGHMVLGPNDSGSWMPNAL